LEESVFVIDPGHGLPDLGAVGPSGLTEAEVNIDVSARLVELLRSPHDIDWATGAVTPGTTVPSVAAAILTRAPDGPNGGDYELGLTFRAMLGNAVDATALVSIHHNTEPTRNLEHPGSSAFVSAANPESPRLGGLIVDELRTAFSRFEADWVGGKGEGLNIRVGADGDDYYTILKQSEHPAVIVEGAYISNPSEEALIMTDAFRQAYADAVYRALVRFVTTDDDPIPAPEPELFDVEAPPRSMDDCVVPTP
jgi:N-acetylmuramoyl-L-alanine amidase